VFVALSRQIVRLSERDIKGNMIRTFGRKIKKVIEGWKELHNAELCISDIPLKKLN
jgi:aromatic ring-opening dioxygenase LigB subunit